MTLVDPKPVGGTESAGAPAGGRREIGRWEIGCNDVIDRRREVTVVVDSDHVVLVGPPGETAVLSLHQAGQLRAALRAAAGATGG